MSEEEEGGYSEYPCSNCGAYRFWEYTTEGTDPGMRCDYCGYDV